MTEYLNLPLRSLEELRDETAAIIDAHMLEQRQITACGGGFDDAGNPRIWAVSDIADARLYVIESELGPLLDRLDGLEEEIGFRGEREERRNSPITL